MLYVSVKFRKILRGGNIEALSIDNHKPVVFESRLTNNPSKPNVEAISPECKLQIIHWDVSSE